MDTGRVVRIEQAAPALATGTRTRRKKSEQRRKNSSDQIYVYPRVIGSSWSHGCTDSCVMKLETIATEHLVGVAGGAGAAAARPKRSSTRKNDGYRELMSDRYNDATSPKDWE